MSSELKWHWNDELFVLRCRIAAGRKGWSLEDLCRAAGANAYFLNKPAPIGRRIDLVVALAQAAEVSLDWLLGLDESPHLPDPDYLATMSAMSNMTAHLYMLMRSQGYAMTPDAVVQIVMDLVDRKVIRPTASRRSNRSHDQPEAPDQMIAEEPEVVTPAPDRESESDAPATRRRRTTRRRSYPL